MLISNRTYISKNGMTCTVKNNYRPDDRYIYQNIKISYYKKHQRNESKSQRYTPETMDNLWTRKSL